MAYRIMDTGAKKGYFVTPLGREGLSAGAQKIAGFEQIGHVRISLDATPEKYVMEFLNGILAQVADNMADIAAGMRDAAALELLDNDGNVIKR